MPLSTPKSTRASSTISRSPKLSSLTRMPPLPGRSCVPVIAPSSTVQKPPLRWPLAALCVVAALTCQPARLLPSKRARDPLSSKDSAAAATPQARKAASTRRGGARRLRWRQSVTAALSSAERLGAARRQVAELGVEQRPLGRARRVRRADRRPHPGALPIGAVLVGIGAGDDEDLLAAAVIMQREFFAGVPFDEVDPLGAMLVQQHLAIGVGLARLPGGFIGVDDDPRAVIRRELAQFDEEGAAFRAERRVAGARRVADIGAGGIVAALVAEHAVEHEYLLAAAMLVPLEAAAGGVAHQGGGARHLAAVALQHLAGDARHRRVDPGQVCRLDDGALRQIGVDQHGIPPARPAATRLGDGTRAVKSRWRDRRGRTLLPAGSAP